eukprot:3401683-Rhodomonas_salina.1
MSGPDTGVRRICCAKSGTDMGYAATRRRSSSPRSTRNFTGLDQLDLTYKRICYAMRGSDRAYGAQMAAAVEEGLRRQVSHLSALRNQLKSSEIAKSARPQLSNTRCAALAASRV